MLFILLLLSIKKKKKIVHIQGSTYVATIKLYTVRPYKITYLILIHLFLKNWGGRRHFIFISVDIRQCTQFVYNTPVPQFENLGATSHLDNDEYHLFNM